MPSPGLVAPLQREFRTRGCAGNTRHRPHKVGHLLHPRATTGSGVSSFPATRIAPTHRTRPTPLASSFRHAQLEDAQHAQLELLEASGDELTWNLLQPPKLFHPVAQQARAAGYRLA